jgi:hypothetical protein
MMLFAKTLPILLCALSIACSTTHDQALLDAALVMDYMKTEDPTGLSVTFDLGSYQGGTAIISAGGKAFWVSEGVAYVVNDAAKKAAPTLGQAPDSVQYDDAFIAAAHAET